MSDLIDRQAALDVLCDACGNCACPKGKIPRCSYYEKMQAIPAASPWHRVEDGLPKDDCEVFTASRLPFDKTDTWIYEHSFFTTDVSECEELKDEYPNEHKAAFYKWSDISDEYVICHYGLKYWMPIEPPMEVMNE